LRGVAIRLRLRLSRGGHSVDVVALVKSGYETAVRGAVVART
jgi:hypothetical protein